MRGESQLPAVSRDVREILEALQEQEKRGLGIYEYFCRFSENIFGFITADMDLAEETRKKISWAKIRVTPSEWWSGFLISIFGPIFLSSILWFLMFILNDSIMAYWYVPVIGFSLSFIFGISFYYYPISTADQERTEAQSRAIETIMLMSFVLQHRSDLRGAAVFAGNASEGALAKDIRNGFLELDQRGSFDSIREMFMAIAHRWSSIDEGVRRAIFDILRSTGQSEESLRLQDVEKAPERVLESSEKQLGSKLDSIVLPTMTFMVFGSLAIVGVIGLSPIYGMIGVNFIDIEFFTFTAVALIASFLAFTIFISRRRPVTFPSPKIPSNDERIPPGNKIDFFGRLIPIWFLPLLVFLILASPGFLYVSGFLTSFFVVSGPDTFWFVWAVAGSISIYAYLRVGPKAEIRKEVEKDTKDWTIALNTIGSRVIDGKPMKKAMNETSNIMSESNVGRSLNKITETMDKFSVNMSYAFFKTGVANRIYNPLVSSFMGVITEIKRGSEVAAGGASMTAAEFLERLNAVERRFEEKIGDATGNLWLMSVVLLPIVSALSVWIMDFMGDISVTMNDSAQEAGLGGVTLLTGFIESYQISVLKVVMGLMVIAIIMILTRHISVISSGRDSIQFWDSVPLAVLSGTCLFTIAYIGFGLLDVAGI